MLKRLSRARRDSATTPKYVELGVVVDDTLAREWEYRFQPLLEVQLAMRLM